MSESISVANQPLNLPNIVEDAGEVRTRRFFLAAAGAAGLLYTAALAYPIYRYLASPE